MSIHSLAHTRFAEFGNEARLVILPDQIVQIMIRFENHIATTPAVAATRAATGRRAARPDKGNQGRESQDLDDSANSVHKR